MNDGRDRVVVLVTGAAGFIGFHLSQRLLAEGYDVTGVDNLNSYYDVDLKRSRLSALEEHPLFRFVEMDISDSAQVQEVFQAAKPQVVINLAAQAGVRYSLINPHAYSQSNLVGFTNILEGCREYSVSHLLYASSSSVYGGNTKVPFEESDAVDHPISLYAATKRANELMADCYSHLYEIPTTGLRFFTVYGPYGRPDMAYFSFADNYFSGVPIRVYDAGSREIMRDFTYIDDVVESVFRLIPNPPHGSLPHRVLNVGGSSPTSLTKFIAELENALGRSLGRPVRFEKIVEEQKPGDVPATYASTDRLEALTGFKPNTGLAEGLGQFADWYVTHHTNSVNASACD